MTGQVTGGSIQPAPVGFWRTVRLLLGAARKRAAGRQKRQQELLRQRARKKNAINWAGFGFVMAVLFMAVINGIAAFTLLGAVKEGERMEAERHGKIVVSNYFLREVKRSMPDNPVAGPSDSVYFQEASNIARDYGGSVKTIKATLRKSVALHGSDDFESEAAAAPGMNALPRKGVLPAMLGSVILIWWCVMVVFQGEGLELDIQRRRHPMWEWLFSHPVQPGAVFIAEIMSPVAANPFYCTAPLFVGFVYGLVYGVVPGILAAFVIGIPAALAAGCLGKALEIGVILRFPPRSRGAIIGMMSWIGYVSMILFFMVATSISKIAGPVEKLLEPLAVLPWPWLGLMLGQFRGTFSFPLGMLVCWCVSGLTIAGAIWFTVWGAQQGLGGNAGPGDSAPSAPKNGRTHFGKEPLYRKEFLWFIRDRSAIVQTILIPLTVAGFQLFNLRRLLSEAQGAWNYLCGAGILFGAYFLWILGPKSLASEGSALWIALTWPRGLESLLKAKAWLWSMISSGMVALVLLYAAYLFPAEAWKILLVGIGWFFFGRSMAEKTVTLVRVPSSSGEPEKIPRSRQWTASLGMLTFSIGILTQQWHVAVMGIVYSYVTAAAMWENFRARLPFLYDQWSETLPPPPTLMHAMIAISILVEGVAVLTGFGIAIAGRENIAAVQVVIYGLCAIMVSVGIAWFLSGRGVTLKDVIYWRNTDTAKGYAKPFSSFLAGVTGGWLLGLFAHGYLAVLQHFPAFAEIIAKSHDQMEKIPGLQNAYFIMAVAFAPFAEEYLFRGLLFRALDREWGGWRAVIGSAAFFAIYHPVLSWVPVGLLGVANALLFKKTGRLAPAILLHMVYNLVVLS